MTKRSNPFQRDYHVTQDALKHFTDREEAIARFDSYLNAPASTDLRLLVFYGVGGVGKTSLQRKLQEQLRNAETKVPFARCSLDDIGDKQNAYREALLRLRLDFTNEHHIQFPRFELTWAIITRREGGAPESLAKKDPALMGLWNLAKTSIQVFSGGTTLIVEGAAAAVEGLARKYMKGKPILKKGFTKDDLERITKIVMSDDKGRLSEELIKIFCMDLAKSMPKIEDRACRGVIFIDGYEKILTGHEGGQSVQSRMREKWVSDLVRSCIYSETGILPVICGRDKIRWDEHDSGWAGDLDQHLLSGLSERDSQDFLSQCGIGPSIRNNQPPNALQKAIINCCREDVRTDSKELSCLPIYLALCADIVLNSRPENGKGLSPEIFKKIPSTEVAAELSDLFLKSLGNPNLELLVIELSLTPRFDRKTITELDRQRDHLCGKAGLNRLLTFSFVEELSDGFYKFHRVVRDILRIRMKDDDAKATHEWFANYWDSRNEKGLHWYHYWLMNPGEAITKWNSDFDGLLSHDKITEARELFFSRWNEIIADNYCRILIGDLDWAMVQYEIARGLASTAFLGLDQEQLMNSIQCCQSANTIWIEENDVVHWALTTMVQGIAFTKLPSFNFIRLVDIREEQNQTDWTEQLNKFDEDRSKAIDCFEAACMVLKKSDYPEQWGNICQQLGHVYSALGSIPFVDSFIDSYFKDAFPEEDAFPEKIQMTNLIQSIKYYEAALEVYTDSNSPNEWANIKWALGETYHKLSEIDEKDENLRKCLSHYESWFRIHINPDSSELWSSKKESIGIIYSWELATGDPKSNRRKAIDCFLAPLKCAEASEHFSSSDMYVPIEEIIRLCNEEEDLEYRDRIINEAIIYCKKANVRFSESTNKHNLISSTELIGDLKSELISGSRQESIAAAIECYESAIEISSKEGSRPIVADWPSSILKKKIGLLYAELYLEIDKPDEQANLRKAIGNLEESLEYLQDEKRSEEPFFTKEYFQEDIAEICLALGQIFARLEVGDSQENLKKSNDYFDECIRCNSQDVRLWYNSACVLARLNNRESKNDISRRLLKAFELENELIDYALTDPDFNSIKNEKWFIDIIEESKRRNSKR